MSAGQRRANGWEFTYGDKVPPQEEGEKEGEDRFSLRMAPYFLLRPFIGAAFGFFGYAALFSGTLITLGSGSRPSLAQGSGPAQLLGMIAVGFLFGLFSKTLHDKLSEGFKAFVNAKAKKTDDKTD
jgi:hypothetical protein